MSWDLIIYTTKNYVTKKMKVTSTFYGLFLCKENDLDIVWKELLNDIIKSYHIY